MTDRTIIVASSAHEFLTTVYTNKICRVISDHDHHLIGQISTRPCPFRLELGFNWTRRASPLYDPCCASRYRHDQIEASQFEASTWFNSPAGRLAPKFCGENSVSLHFHCRFSPFNSKWTGPK